MSTDRIPARRGIASLADIPEGECRHGPPELVIRCKHSVIPVTVLARRRYEIGEPVEELKRREFDDAISSRNNLDYWAGQAEESARDEYIYYAESRIQAIRMNQWKAHFFIRDGYYGTTTKLDLPWLFNLRQDPHESYDQAPGPRATLSQQKTYLFNDIVERLGRHMATLQKYPPKQRGSSLSIGN